MSNIYTVYDLMADLSDLLGKHPDVDFSKLPVVLGCEYDASDVELRTTGWGTFVNIS